MTTTLVEAAVEYSQIGWSVIPIRALDDPHPSDLKNDKRPYVKWKPFQTTRADEGQIRKWWKKWPKARIGIVTGKISNLVVIDFDGPDARAHFEARICQIPETITQSTGRLEGGSHVLFAHGGNHNLRPVVGKDYGSDIDVRADGAYIVVAPSPHKSGLNYTWGKIHPVEHGLDDLLDLPQDVLDFCKQPAKINAPKEVTKETFNPDGSTKNKPGWVNELLWGVGEGRRNHCCAKLGGYYLRYFAGDADLALVALEGWNARNKPPLDKAEISKTLDSIKSREGVSNLSNVIGTEIDQLEKLKYPDGDVKYNLYVEGLDNGIQLSADELINPRKFRVKLMVLTDRVLPPVKEAVWFSMVEGALKDAPEIIMSEDETNIAIIKRVILNDLRRGEMESPEVHLENIAVIYNGYVHMYLNTISKNLKMEKVFFKSAKELGTLLRKIGFDNAGNRINGSIYRTWSMKLDSFKNSCAMDDIPI